MTLNPARLTPYALLAGIFILALDEVPVLSPTEELATMHPVEGYHLELVAAEPLVQDPVAIDFDADGRMYVVEMRAFMPNIQGTGEDRPIGRIVVVEDTNHDGRMDKSTVFMDSLVLPRAVKVLAHGVLVAAPPNLWLVHDTNGDLRADTKELIRTDYGDPKGNPEHNANGLLWGIDNWIHNANYPGEFHEERDGGITFRKAPEEGQWGVSTDENGRLYRNSNEDPVRADLVSSQYAMRNPNLPNPRGVYEQLTKNIAVWPAHKTPAVNRGYRAETMRPDSTLAHYTSAGSPTAYIGDALPAELKSSVFITESAGNLVGRVIVNESTRIPSVQSAYDHREFLTADDERFRPVNLANAPDGTLYIVDMYRGIIQHRTYITGYLESKIKERGLEQPVGLGRIWRVVHTSTKRDTLPRLSTESPAKLVAELSSANGWRRYKAQQILVERRDTTIAPALRTIASRSANEIARLHALWTLDGIGAIDDATLWAFTRGSSAAVRAAVLQIAEPRLAQGDSELVGIVGSMMHDGALDVRRQAAATAGSFPGAERDALLQAVIIRDGDDPIVTDMVVTAVGGREVAFTDRLLARPVDSARLSPALRTLAKAVATSRDSVGIEHLVTIATDTKRATWARRSILEGLRRPAPAVLATLGHRPAGLIAMSKSRDTTLASRALAISDILMWPGKKVSAAKVAPLSPAERQRFAAGQLQYKATCQGCHQANGMGLANVAKPLVGSPWAIGDADKLIRIVLHGKEGAMLMPPVGATLTNEQIASVLTYVRRSWGNAASAIDANAVKEVRGLTTGRTRPWTEEELRRARR
jgi:putative membrane-bound dehydrogenase-like protein